MIERIVTKARLDEKGQIVAVGNPVEWWSPRAAIEVINDIEESFYRYFIMLEGEKVILKVVNGSGDKHLTSDPDKTQINVLAELPAC